MNARQHAQFASELLDGIASLQRRLDAMTEDERLQAAVSGGMKRANDDLRWTCELAQAHATVALALVSTEDP